MWATLDVGLAPVVMGRRAAGRDDYVMTRLIELVVHADDFRVAMPEAVGSPIDDESLAAVSDALASAYEERAGHRPDASDPVAWIRLATGRTPSDDPALPLL